jgi:hypothetical protein
MKVLAQSLQPHMGLITKKSRFVFPNADFALTFGIPNADSVSTSHFHPIPLKTISLNSTNGTNNTYPRLRVVGYLNSFHNQRKPSTEEEHKAPQRQTVLIRLLSE